MIEKDRSFTRQDGADTAVAADYFVRGRDIKIVSGIHLADDPALAQSLPRLFERVPKRNTGELANNALHFLGEFYRWKELEKQRFSLQPPTPGSLLDRLESVQMFDVYLYANELYGSAANTLSESLLGTKESKRADRTLVKWDRIRKLAADAHAIETGGNFKPYEEDLIETFLLQVFEDGQKQLSASEIAAFFREWQEEMFVGLHMEGEEESQKMALALSNLTLDRIADFSFYQYASLVINQGDQPTKNNRHEAEILRYAAEISSWRYSQDIVSTSLEDNSLLSNNIMIQAENIVDSIAPDFGRHASEMLIPPIRPLTKEEQMAIRFLILIMYFPKEPMPDNEIAENMWKIFPQWQQGKIQRLSSSINAKDQEDACALNRISFADVVAAAELEVRYHEEVLSLSKDSDVPPPHPFALNQWRYLQKITNLAASQHNL